MYESLYSRTSINITKIKTMDLKHKLTAYFIQNEYDLGKEEVFNILQLLGEYDNDLSGLDINDSKLITRLIDNTELYNAVENITSKYEPKNPFG